VLNTCSTSAIGHQQTTPGIGIPSVHCQTAAQGVARQLFPRWGSSAITSTSATTGYCAASVNSTRLYACRSCSYAAFLWDEFNDGEIATLPFYFDLLIQIL
jgi:hypothetical protein